MSEQHLPIARNTATLAVIQALYSTVLQLSAAVLSLSFVLVTGFRSLLGAGPAIFLTASALAALPAGRAMDRFGRVPVIVVGFLLGSIGYSLAAVGTHWGSGVALITGFAFAGIAGAVTLLIRTAAGDMYPPERRARGISYVLFGSVFGAVLGPSLFGPLFAGKDVAADTLTVPWLAAAGLSLVTCGLALTVRPDTKVIAERIAPDRLTSATTEAAPLREILRRPGVIPAMLAAIASFGVMVSVMNLTGFVVVEHHHHSQQSVFPIIGAHVLGMYALVLVIGTLIDKIGRGPALAGGLFVMAISCAGLTWATSVPTTALLLFGLGIGWNLSFVAATAQLADATLAAERGKLLGFSDLLSGLTAAALALLGGVALDVLGVAALALGATAIAIAPADLPCPHPARPRARRMTAGTIAPRRTMVRRLFAMQKTWNAKPGEIERHWYVVDAEGKTLGRLATRIADTLRGKGKPQYTPHVDTGDFVVVVNAEKITVTGKKLDDKMYYRHSGYPGGLRSRPLRDELERRPTEVLRKAVKGMLPRNRLGRAQLLKLKVYAGPEHPHEAQGPKPLPLENGNG